MAWQYDQLLAKVCEQVNRKCLFRNMILQLSVSYTDSGPSNYPPLATKTRSG